MLLCVDQNRYHPAMANRIFSPAQIAYLELLEVALPECVEKPQLPTQKELHSMPEMVPTRVQGSRSGSTVPDIPELSAEEPLADENPTPVPSAEEKKPAQPVAPTTPGKPSTDERVERITRMDWSLLEASIHACRACSLGETRKNAVVGAGTRPSPWLFVGEAPGAEEDRRGEAFVGRGGQLLDAMLAAMGLSRKEQVYIANVLKCRPPQNRDPLGPEVRSCLPFLQRQIALLQPRIIVAMGRFAAQSLLQSTEPLASLRGNVQHYGEIPLIVTYHPAYLLRNPIEKRKVWEDLKLALQIYADLPQVNDANASATE